METTDLFTHTKTLQPLKKDHLKAVGWSWLYEEAGDDYVTNEVVVVTEEESEAYYVAAEELFGLFTRAAADLMNAPDWQARLRGLAIPENLHRAIRSSWDSERDFHLYSRFDLAGGLTGRDIKLYEVNADVATFIPETAILQWALLVANQLDEEQQFNRLYEALVEGFKIWKDLSKDFDPVLVLAHMDSREDAANVEVLAEAAQEAGFDTYIRLIEEVTFSEGEGVFVQEDHNWVRCDFFFKLVPWEFLSEDAEDHLAILTGLLKEGLVTVANPAYTMIYQSKLFLETLWEANKGHHLLLPASRKRVVSAAGDTMRSVEKPAFGREGASVAIYDEKGRVEHERPGAYDDHAKVYQAFYETMIDDQFRHIQAGVFYAGGEACGLAFRRGGLILDDTSQLLGHLIEG